MARKLKTYTTSAGFFDLADAAPSTKVVRGHEAKVARIEKARAAPGRHPSPRITILM
jgi:hypothetical protein